MKLSEILFGESQSFNLSREPAHDINDPNMMTKGTDDSDAGIYCNGLCGEFAVALSEMFGYELGMISQVNHDSFEEEDYSSFAHAFCKHPTDNSLGIDAVGIRPIDEMMEDTQVDHEGKLVVEPTTRVGLDELWMEGLDEGVVSDAKAYITAHRARYEV